MDFQDKNYSKLDVYHYVLENDDYIPGFDKNSLLFKDHEEFLNEQIKTSYELK